jgi:hypothetical protein
VAIWQALWEWINTRDGFWLRPRTAEQFDILLNSLTGKSLKTEAKLWETFKNLGAARHSFVHTGFAKIGNDDVTQDRAKELIDGAFQIVAWAESFLPKDSRRAELEGKREITVMTAIPIATLRIVAPQTNLDPEKHEV